jgi:hypothetical protein
MRGRLRAGVQAWQRDRSGDGGSRAGTLEGSKGQPGLAAPGGGPGTGAMRPVCAGMPRRQRPGLDYGSALWLSEGVGVICLRVRAGR